MILAVLVVSGWTVPTAAARGHHHSKTSAAAHAPGQVETTTFTDAGLSVATAQGTVDELQQFVPVPPGEGVSGGTLTLHFAHSPLLLADVSTITVAVDGQSLTSARLGPSTVTDGTLTVPVPAQPGATGLTIAERFYLRTTRRCEDPANPALWASVLPTSRVTLRLTPAGRTVDTALADLAPGPGGLPLTVVLAPSPDPAQLRAAGILVAAVGRHDAALDVDPLVRVAATVPARGPWLRIGSGPSGPARVTVVGQGDPGVVLQGAGGALVMAARALAGGALTGAHVDSVALNGAPAPPPRASLPWTRGAASFAQLGVGDRVVAGPGGSDLQINVARPPQWDPTGDAVLHLAIAPGAGLAAGGGSGTTPSTVTVSLAGHGLGSRRLVPGGVDEMDFAVPSGLVSTDLSGRTVRNLAVQLGFDLQVPHLPCVPEDPRAATVTVLETSSLTLPHSRSEQLDLSRFPAPMTEPGRSVAIVLPSGPSLGDLTGGLQLAAAVGRWADPRAPLPDLVTVAQHAALRGSLLLVGDADRELGHRLAAPATVPVPVPGAELVLGHWPATGAPALAIHAAGGPGLLSGALALSEAAAIARLRGSAMTVLPGSSSVSTRRGTPVEAPPVELAPVLATGFWSSVSPWAIPAAVMLVLLLVGGGLLVRARWRGSHRDLPEA